MRTLLRPGRRGVLVRIEGRRSTRFVVGGPDSHDRQVFFDLGEAVRSFVDIEEGRRVAARTVRSPLQIVQRVGQDLLSRARHFELHAH